MTVTIRQPRESDVGARARAGMHPDVYAGFARYAEERPLTEAEAASWLHRLTTESAAAWVIAAADGRPCGQILLHSLNEPDGNARLAVGLWRREDLGRGIGPAAVRLALQHAFEVMGLHRVDLWVLAFNTRAIAAYRRCGFTEEGRARETCWFREAWHDDILMSILDREWEAGRGH